MRDAAAPTTSTVQAAFEGAGLHPRVQLIVDEVRWREGVLTAQLRLRYAAAYPLCCAEPACYVPALRPAGLAAVAAHLRAEELLDGVPRLAIGVTLELEPGFHFLNPELGATTGTTLRYSYP